MWGCHPEHLLALLERLARTEHQPEGGCPRSTLRLDVTAAREARRERSGFVSVDAARSFLALATAGPLEPLLNLETYDLETARHLRGLRTAPGSGRPGDARGPDDPGPTATTASGHHAAHALEQAPLLRDLLSAAGILAEPTPMALLPGPGSGPLTLTGRLRDLAGRDSDASARVAAELAYLANVVLVAVAMPGEGREADARELVFATASLGIELLEARRIEVHLDRPPGLIRAFLVAWRTLHELPQRVVPAFEATLDGAATQDWLAARPWLREQILASLTDLRREVREQRFAAARESVGLLSLAFDVAACRAVATLMDEPPRFSSALQGSRAPGARWFGRRRDLERVQWLLTNLERRR